MAKLKYSEPLGKKYGKPDLERIGIFMEMSYMHGKRYTTPHPKSYLKGLNFMAGGRKTKCGTQDGYFDDEFKRLFEGEAISRRKPKETREAEKRAQKPAFTSPGITKWHSTPGDNYGCFSGVVEAFGNARKPQPRREKVLPNCQTRPLKGGGPGYADICFSKYPEHLPEPYRPKIPKGKSRKMAVGLHPMITYLHPRDFFQRNPYADEKGTVGPTYVRPRKVVAVSKGIFVPTGPGKWQGGAHHGCFSPFPGWEPPKAVKKSNRQKGKTVSRGQFLPQSSGQKTMYTFSTLHLNTDFRINRQNYATYKPNYVKYFKL